MKLLSSVFLLLILCHGLIASEKRINTNLLANMITYPNIEYDHQLIDNWFISTSAIYRLKSSPFLVTTDTKLSLTSFSLMFKRYFDYETTGFYLGVGFNYTFYRVYDAHSNGVEIEYRGDKMNDFSWMYEVGYSNFLAKHIFYTTYVGASEHYIGYHVLDSNSDNATASVVINFEPHIGLCLGYQF
ncbi:hypothetical protein CL658_03925 [bacterium]|nr:hypothetical protein [bacterium]|tara:strand:+ start:1012 stop:1569 length:558 start_codon:yes stop_codon:yes gene_type:complete